MSVDRIDRLKEKMRKDFPRKDIFLFNQVRLKKLKLTPENEELTMDLVRSLESRELGEGVEAYEELESFELKRRENEE